MEAKTLYFPICLLRDFEENEQYTAKKILKYCHDTIRAKKGEKEATKTLNQIIDFDIKYSLEPHSPMTYINADFVKNLANGYDCDYMDKCLFLFVCSVNSILMRKDYLFTNWLLVASRASGFRGYDKKRSFYGIPKRLTGKRNVSNVFYENLMRIASDRYGINLYFHPGMKGFYIYRNMTENNLKEVEKDVLSRKIKQAAYEDKTKVAQNKLSKETKLALVGVIAKNKGIEIKPCVDFLEYLEAEGVSLKDTNAVGNKMEIYYK